ncbi:hypothetical protein EBO34_15980 [Alteribacter keqinensis]|uniref:Uncharacterized protein n=1 Tax=Alteribacter keqinensis TaxID=2483800 RepID=A0A3M7TM63_9BACI|nr:hypothetical protein EBO34_15980 [Alteribacter keqinensis]
MKVFYNLSPKQISNVIKRIESVCTKVLFNIERNKKYHLGEVAFDLILDKNLHIWLLELQVNIAAETKALMSEDNHFVLPAIMPASIPLCKIFSWVLILKSFSRILQERKRIDEGVKAVVRGLT